MSDELREGLRSAAGGGGSRPDVADLWRAGRRRRTARRLAGAAAAVVVVLAIGAAAIAMGPDEGTEQLRTTDVPTTIDPGSCEPAATSVDQAPPATVDEFVRGIPSAGRDGVPTVIARGRVERAYWHGPTDLVPGPPAWNRMVTLVVTDPVTGAEAGDHLDVLTNDPIPSQPATPQSDERRERSVKQVQQRIDDLQRSIDEIDRPLAALDAEIDALLPIDPADPRFQALQEARSAVEQEANAARVEAQDRLSALKQELQRYEIAERQGMSATVPRLNGPPCHPFQAGDDVIVALKPGAREPLYLLASPSSFFVVGGDGRLSVDLDAARRSVPSWGGDTELLRTARDVTPDGLMAVLRQAAAD